MCVAINIANTISVLGNKTVSVLATHAHSGAMAAHTAAMTGSNPILRAPLIFRIAVSLMKTTLLQRPALCFASMTCHLRDS